MRSLFILQFDNGLAKNQTLWGLVEHYLISQGANDTQASLAKMARVWVEIVETEHERKCVGIIALAQVWWVPIFHCDDDRTRSRFVQRLSTVLEENAGGNGAALVHVDKEKEGDWKNLLEYLDAKKADTLWLVPVGPQINLTDVENLVEAT